MLMIGVAFYGAYVQSKKLKKKIPWRERVHEHQTYELKEVVNKTGKEI